MGTDKSMQRIYFRHKKTSNKAGCFLIINKLMAERKRFELLEGINLQRFSRPPLSATQPPLHITFEISFKEVLKNQEPLLKKRHDTLLSA